MQSVTVSGNEITKFYSGIRDHVAVIEKSRREAKGTSHFGKGPDVYQSQRMVVGSHDKWSHSMYMPRALTRELLK